MEPWEIAGGDGSKQEIILLDLNDHMNKSLLEKDADLIRSLNEEYDILLNKTVKNLDKARQTHMKVESMYVPNMNFTQISNLAEQVEEELEKIG